MQRSGAADIIDREEEDAVRDEMIVPGYRLEREIARGGMSTVYLARKREIGTVSAVKVLSRETADDRSFVRRFIEEARTTARFSHPNIVHVIDAGKTTDGRYYIAMEYVDGRTVGDRIREKGPLEEREALRIIEQAASALEAAHSMGLLHRDVKPGNIMMDGDGVARLCDFGLALPAWRKPEAEGLVYGTPEYMAPEQARGSRDLDSRADLYSLGATLYHMLFGRPLFSAANPQLIAALQITEQPVIPETPPISPATRSLLAWTLQKDPDARPQTAAELRAAVHRILAGETSVSLGTTTVTLAVRRLRRRLRVLLGDRRFMVIAATAFAAALVVLGLLLR